MKKKKTYYSLRSDSAGLKILGSSAIILFPDTSSGCMCAIDGLVNTEFPKIYRQSVLHLLKYRLRYT